MTRDTAEVLGNEDSIEKILRVLDSDNDGVIDMDEWLYNLDCHPILKSLIDRSVDLETGKISY